jgi:tetratricopeptide (TPR) repeat protein
MLPSDSSLALAAGELYRRLGRDADAQAAFAEALRLVDAAGAAEGNNFETFYERAPMLLRMGRAAKVVTETSARLRRSPDNQGFLALRCLARATGGIELEAAAKDCDSAVAFDPRDDSAHRARALLKLRLRQWDAAIADYDAVLAVVPRDGSALFGRGIAKARRGDRAGADRDVAAARRYDSEIAERFEEMGLTP